MATTAELQITVHVYGAQTTRMLLLAIAHLSPFLGARVSIWLANRIVHRLVWMKVGRRWERLGKDIEVSEGD